MLAMPPRDLLAFAQMHLTTAVPPTAPGARTGTAAAMHARQVDLPPGPDGYVVGPRVRAFDTPEGAIIGHDGGTIGQSAFLGSSPTQAWRLRC